MTSRTFLGAEYMAERGKYAGPSILELMERRLDLATEANLSDGDLYSNGVLYGLANAIAIMRNPYSYLGIAPAPDFVDFVAAIVEASEGRVEEKARAAAQV